jgi:hypothetical protein
MLANLLGESSEDAMPSLHHCAKAITLVVAASLLGACATHDYLSDMYASEDGRPQGLAAHFDASFDPDSRALTNGLYSARP